MSLNLTYPGVYIQELPSLVHNVSAAPTSIAVFVGYTNPVLTAQPAAPVQLFSFADYQANFGGFFSSLWQPDYVGQAVNEFFLNGGSTAYVVGLVPSQYYLSSSPYTAMGSVVAASVVIDAGESGESFTLTAQQPVGVPASGSTPAAGIPMQATISNLRQTTNPNDTADIVVSYGTVVETYRRVLVTQLASALAASRLVTVTLSNPAPDAFPTSGSPFALGYASAPDPSWTVFSPAGVESDIGGVLAVNAPLDKVPVFNLLAIPGITDPTVMADAVAYCERKRAFMIMDPPSSWGVDALTSSSPLTLDPAPPISTNGALYFPWLQTTDPVTGLPSSAPPSGFVAGAYATQDTSNGVWTSPAGIQTSLLGTTGVVSSGVMTDMQQGVLNQGAVNCLRDFPGTGTVVFGARTLASTDQAYQQWMYVAVRRMALFLEQSLYASLTWAVFQPNSDPLWQALSSEVSAFMLSLFRQGAFAGTTPSNSFLVQCDATTTTATDIANGVVNILVGFAPLEPAEFVVVQIAQLAGQASS